MTAPQVMSVNRYARARELAGLSVGQAARRFGVTTAALRSVEQAQAVTGALTPELLAETYGCSVAWLTGAVPRFDHAAVNGIPGGRDLDFCDRDAIAELLAARPRRTL